MSSRRGFIKSGALAVFGISLGGVPGFVLKAAHHFNQQQAFKREKY